MLVAPGWMIESDAGGSITLRICSDPANPGGTMTIPLEKAGSHDAGAVQQHCPWGALANAPIVPDLPVLAAAPPAVEPEIGRRRGGQKGVSTWRSRMEPYVQKTKNHR